MEKGGRGEMGVVSTHGPGSAESARAVDISMFKSRTKAIYWGIEEGYQINTIKSKIALLMKLSK
jgi:hypothetical protein